MGFKRFNIYLACLFVVSLAVVSSAQAKVISGFGVSLPLPSHWRLLTNAELAAVDAVETEAESVNEREQLSDNVKGGNLELILNTQKPKVGQVSYSNITLIQTKDQVPEAAAQIKSTCGALPSLLSKTLQRKVVLNQCEGLNLQGYPALLLTYAGDTEPSQIVQYMVQLKQNLSLVITLTYLETNPETRQEFETAIRSLEVLP